MPRSDPASKPRPGRSFGMDSDVDHRLDGTDPDEVRPYGWWLKVREMIDEWREIKHMSPVELRHYCGGRS